MGRTAGWVAAVLLGAPQLLAHPAVGAAVENPTLSALEGPAQPLLLAGKINVIVFVRPGQERSQAALRELAPLARELAGKPVWLVAVVSDHAAAEDARRLVQDSGSRMPVLVDAGDALYGQLNIVQHPVVVITGADLKVAASQPSTSVNFAALVRGQVRLLLGEITAPEWEQVQHPAGSTLSSARDVARRHVKMGQRLLDGGSAAKALESARKALEVDATLAAGHTLAGRALRAQGRCAEAVKEFDQALAQDGADTAAQEGRAACVPTK